MCRKCVESVTKLCASRRTFWRNCSEKKCLITLLHIEQKSFAINMNFSDTSLKTSFTISMKNLWGTLYLLETKTCFYQFWSLSKNISCFRQQTCQNWLIGVQRDFSRKIVLFEKIYFFFFLFSTLCKNFRPSGKNFLTMFSELHSSIPAERFEEDYTF